MSIDASGTAAFTVSTEDDAVDEEDGTIAAMLTAGTGYTVGSVASASVAVADNDVSVSSIPMLSVSDASADEGEAVEFVIRLSRPHDKIVALLARTRESNPVSAVQGTDFSLSWFGAVFRSIPAGETERTVKVRTLDDLHNDGETFELYIARVYYPGVGIADGVGVGAIRNSDPIPAAWLGRFGRTVSQQVVDALRQRFSASAPIRSEAHGGG
ncbi:hypothetical protein [Candidatus Synechococcus spongiarum]|uniref:hypothetical protein n=1 Tax=Candidatus Synechococcus spongiarum TaxID=431041 RepID=UPI00046EEB58|nr:hypothetical protein [Candidatus Synechococcus spongiarum]